MRFDEKNNIIGVCLFESYLAKYFIEHPEIFRPLILKILDAIACVIKDNSDNPLFDRMLFSVFSTVAEDSPNVHDLDTLKQSDSIVAVDTFFKYFVERIMSNRSIKLQGIGQQGLLSEHSLFKPSTDIFDIMRPKTLFTAKGRGVIELKDLHEMETRDLGILSVQDTPEQLKSYFLRPHSPIRQHYSPKEDSLMAQWLRKYYLPVISGISGGIGITIGHINSLIQLSKREYELLGIMVASSTIALGHHSFFEVIKPLSFFTRSLEDQSNLLEFYAQIIPEEIKRLPSYQLHMESEFGAQLIEEFIFDNPQPEQINSKIT